MKKFLILISWGIASVLIVSAQTAPQQWDFLPPYDHFSGDALLDLRFLNEDYAGQNGFITLAPDSNSFVTGNGKPVRFWAINGGENTTSWADGDLARFARFLAKIGVNVIRYHGSLHPVSSSSGFNNANPAEIRNIQRLVAAMKKEGIYTVISPYYSHKVSEVFASWNIPEYTGKSPKLDGVIYFHDGLRNAYKQWVTELFTAQNPYGVPLKDEPAVAVIQTHNEDGLFFYTTQQFKPGINQVVRKRFYDWLMKKYSSIQAAQSAWGSITIDGDNPAIGEMGIYIIWEATQSTSGPKHKRLTDQMEYLSDVQTGFYREMAETFRKAGCKQLVNGSNWKAADAIRLLDVERATAGICDVIALNRYYSPTHTGYKSSPDNSAWRIDPGHYYEGKSALLAPEALPINVKQPVSRPVMVTESGWNLPHKYQSEGPFLIAAYSALAGIDAFFWFTASAPSIDTNPFFTWTTFSDGQHPLHRWTVSTPGQMAMFPANALMFRLGYVQESKTMVLESRTRSSLLNREIPVISEEMGFDPNRDDYIPVTGQTELSGVSYLAGKIQVKYHADQNAKQIDGQLPGLINFQDKKITSATGELQWDYKKGICTLNTPSAQGVCGFVGQNPEFQLSDVTIRSQNEYAAIQVVAMDQKPISGSGKLLLQVGTISRPSGWSESPSEYTYKGLNYKGFLINKTGQMPWQCVNTWVTVTVKNKYITSAKQLDVAGYVNKELPFTRNGDQINLSLPTDAMYVVLQGSPVSSGTIKKKESEFRLYPNPASGNFRVELPESVVQECELEIRDLCGRVVRNQKLSLPANEPVNIRMLTSGLYLVSLKSGGQLLAVKRLVIR